MGQARAGGVAGVRPRCEAELGRVPDQVGFAGIDELVEMATDRKRPNRSKSSTRVFGSTCQLQAAVGQMGQPLLSLKSTNCS
jgi:hypothetical protein